MLKQVAHKAEGMKCRVHGLQILRPRRFRARGFRIVRGARASPGSCLRPGGRVDYRREDKAAASIPGARRDRRRRRSADRAGGMRCQRCQPNSMVTCHAPPFLCFHRSSTRAVEGGNIRPPPPRALCYALHRHSVRASHPHVAACTMVLVAADSRVGAEVQAALVEGACRLSP